MKKQSFYHMISFFMLILLSMIFSTTKISAQEIQIGEYKSSLPVIYINTENGADITSKEIYISGDMTLQGNEQFISSDCLYEGSVEIKGHGNMTWSGSNKKPYHIKLEERVNLLNLGKGKHWILLANYYDESLLRSKLASDLAASLGITAMDSTWVDLILNGKYTGTYQLCEQIRIAKERVNITDWEEYAEDFAKKVYQAEKENGFTKDMRNEFENSLTMDLSWISSGTANYNNTNYHVSDYNIQLPDLNGGFLLEMDHYYDEISKFRTNKTYAVNIKRPAYLSSNNELFYYAKNYLQLYENSVFSQDYFTEYNEEKYHYSQLVDMESLVNFWLVTEIMFNIDSGWKSTYLYKDVNEIMKYGPVWDFDLSAGNPIYTEYSYNSWWSRMSQAYYFNQIINDPYFLTKIRETYWNNHFLVENMINETGAIQEYNNYIFSSAASNSAIWKWTRGYEKDVDYLTTWITNRVNWMDAQMNNQDVFLSSISAYEKSNKLTLTIENMDANEYPPDTRNQNIAGNYDVTSENAIQLKTFLSDDSVSQLDIVINGISYRTIPVMAESMTIEINRSFLSEPKENLNVLIVYGKNSAGQILHSNFVTLYDSTSKEIEYEWEPDGKLHTKYAVSPTASPECSVTGTPSPTPEFSPESDASPKPAPTITILPTDTPFEPLPAETVSATENESVSKDQKKEFTKGSLRYQIISSATKKNGTVMIIGTKKNNYKKIIIPQKVIYKGNKYNIISIRKKSFSSCQKLKIIKIKSTTLKRVEKNIFNTQNTNISIQVPKTKRKSYIKLFKKYPRIKIL